MLRLAKSATYCLAVILLGCSVWIIADWVAHPFQPLTRDEQARLEKLIADHEFLLELHVNESGLPYHTSTLDPEVHALFAQNPIATLHFLRREVTESEPKLSIRAAALALETGKDSYSAWLYDLLEQDYDKENPYGNTHRDRLLAKIDDRIKKISADERKTNVTARRSDRGTLGSERQTIEEADPTDELVVVELVETSQGKGYWMR